MKMFRFRVCLILAVLALGARAVRAAEDADTTALLSAIRTEVVAADRIADEFRGLAGSPRNAQNLVVGMRNAKPVALAGNARGNEMRFKPTRKPMSFTDIHTALSLVQAQLKSQRIDSPTPAQLRASLAGGKLPDANGDIRDVIGILPMRHGGMSWEQIAQALHIALPRRNAVSES